MDLLDKSDPNIFLKSDLEGDLKEQKARYIQEISEILIWLRKEHGITKLQVERHFVKPKGFFLYIDCQLYEKIYEMLLNLRQLRRDYARTKEVSANLDTISDATQSRLTEMLEQEVDTYPNLAKAAYAKKLNERVALLGKWGFPELWMGDIYSRAMAQCIEAFQASYIPKAFSKAGNNISRAAILSKLDRKAFGKWLKKYENVEPIFDFTEEDMNLPYGDLKQEIVSDFQMQFVARALDEFEGNISRAAGNVQVDRKYFRSLIEKILIRIAEIGDELGE